MTPARGASSGSEAAARLEATRLRELLAINRAITSTTDYEETLALVVERACTFSHADACLLLLAEPGERASIAASFGNVPEKVRHAELMFDEHLTARLERAFELPPAGAVTALPIIRGGVVRGGLVVVHRRREDEPTQERMLSVLADHASIVLGHVAHLRELRLAEAKASGILSISADAIISIDAEQRITMFNEGAERIFGYSKDEMMGADLGVLLPTRVAAIHRRYVESFCASRGSAARKMGGRGAVVVGRRKNGDEFPIDAAISKLDVAGEAILTVVLRDISQQRRVENEQRFLAEVGPVLASTLDYEETLASIAKLAVRDIADLCVVEVMNGKDQRRKLRVVSRDPEKAAICELLSRVDDEASGAPDLLKSVLATRRSVLLQLSSADAIAELVQREDHRALVRAAEIRSMVAVPLTAHGQLLGAIAFISTSATHVYGSADVSLAEELARRAALSIENAGLYREARRATQARDNILGVVAHDLRNPLNVILVHTAIVLRDAADDGVVRGSAQAIKHAVSRMNRLIQDLLDVTAIDAGQLSVERAWVRPEKVVTDVIEAERSLADAASIELRLELAPDLPAVWADRDRLAQVFENLIANAMKFTGRGGHITVGATQREGEIRFWVADSGSGIDAEHLPHVFDRFWQADKRTRHGAGLGLTIVKGLIEAHRGRISVDSTPGEGTTVSFTIPTRA